MEAPYSIAELKTIKGVQFGILSPDELRRYSVVHVETADTFDKGRPKEKGLSDLRLGTLDRGAKCTTDGMGHKDCPGYFGHVELAKPVFHVGMLNYVLKVLRCVSFQNSKLLLQREDPAWAHVERIRNPKTRLRKFVDLCKGKTQCPVTGAPQPTFRTEGGKIFIEYRERKNQPDLPDAAERKQLLTAEKVWEVFRLISDEDVRALGLNPAEARPEWMVLTVLPVPPPNVRPSVMSDSGRSEDDLTHKLAEIVRANVNLRRQIANGAPAHVVQEFVDLLQFHISTYFDNTVAGQPRATMRSGRAVKSISERLKGKHGRVRGNLMGKRVDFSARSVITPDPNLSVDQLGVPWSIALNMTFPETVTPYNYARMTRLVENGPHPPPGETGARCIIRDDGTRIDLKYVKRDADRHLEIGYKVERHMQDGDLVLFNRQPSLHKMSIMGHRVRIMPYSTFRLNLSVTTPYNADFDGDEMNMHLPQSHETRAEVRELMMVPRMIVSPQANKPVMGIVQDTLLGCRLITMRSTFIERDAFFNILMWLEHWDGRVPAPAILKPRPLWTGKQVFSMFLPNISLRSTSAWHADGEREDFSPGDTQVLIESGELLTGTLCKKTVGAGAGGLVHVVWMEHGPDAARGFLSQTQTCVNYWLLQHGFSVGIGDTIADAPTLNKIYEVIQAAKDDVKDLVRQAQEKRLEPLPGMTMQQSFEKHVNQRLNKAVGDSGKQALSSIPQTNRVLRMVSAGSKGSNINIAQMTACVGQQNVEGQRIRFGFENRTLPHFTKDDYGPESRGFVENSYLRGLTPQEFFFHAMGGREGLIDTAVKTSETGYIQRRLVKAMEDAMIRYDGTVRNGAGNIIQFLYGEDGMAAELIEKQKLDSLRLGAAEFDARYKLDGADLRLAETLGSAAAAADVREAADALAEEYETLLADRAAARAVLLTGDDTIPLPVNISRIVWNAQKKFRIGAVRARPGGEGDAKGEALLPSAIWASVKELVHKLVVVPGDDRLSAEAQKNATVLFNVLLRSKLAAKRVLREYRLNAAAFAWVLGEVEERFKQALALPGEMIGTVAAQSIGEPATQMTLNTFHYAGVSAKNVTLGVPRLKEIINIAKKIKTPSLTVYLDDATSRDKEKAKAAQSSLEYTTLANVMARTEIWYDPDPLATVVPEDADVVQMFWELADEGDRATAGRMSPWLLRVELSREMMVDKKLTMAGVTEVIEREYKEDISVVCTDDNAPELVLRIRLINDAGGKGDGDDDGGAAQSSDDALFLKEIEGSMLARLKLRGIEGIRKVFIQNQLKRVRIDAATGKYAAEPEWTLDTEGCALQAVLCAEGVDATRTQSNHLIEVLEVLGIEGVRNALLKELRGVIEFDGSYVNYRHMAILCEVMTYRGHLMSITRHGINRVESGPLMRCSFEETVDILMESAVFSELDGMRGVSEAIMLGQFARIGTGAFDLLLDPTQLANAIDAGGFDLDGAMGRGGATTPLRASPGGGGATPGYALGGASPSFLTSPTLYSPVDGALVFSERGANAFSPTSPGYSPTSPGYSPTSPASPAYSPTSPAYSPTSPAYSPTRYVNRRPRHFASLSSGRRHALLNGPTRTPPNTRATPAPLPLRHARSPAYSPTSPAYSPTSPTYSPASPQYSPTSPSYSPSDAAAAGGPSPAVPAFSPGAGAAASPASPAYSPGPEQPPPQ